MADPKQSQTPTQQEYDQDQAGATPPTPASDDSLEGWTPVEGTQKAAAAPAVPADDKSLEGWTPVEGTAKAIAQPASAAHQEKPGYWTRLGQSVGLPTTAAELPSFLQHTYLPLLFGGVNAVDAQQVKDYVMKTYNDLHDALKEQNEALENAQEGGPFWSNLAKGMSGVVKFGVHQVPFIGEPTYTAGEDVANKNYKGAAGGLTGVVAQIVLPEILHRTSLGGRIESAIKEHANAKTVLEGRTGELEVATKQAQDAEAKATDLRRRQAAGEPVINSGIIQADEDASAARANATKAQKAFSDAQTARNEAAAKVSTLVQRVAEKARKAAEKSREEQAFHEQVKKQEKASKVKTGTPEEVAKSTDDFQKAIPPGTGKAAYTPEDLKNTRPILQKAHAGTPIDSPQAVVDALESDRVSRDNEVRGLVRDNGKYANEPLLLTDDAGNPVSVKQKLVEALSEDEKTRPGFTEAALKELERFNTTDPTLDEADKLRETLNSENRDKLNTPQGKRAISDARETDPEFAARYELQDILRDGIYGRLEEKGVKGARESRRLDASVIRVKNAAERQIRNTDKVVRGSSEVGAFRKGAAKVSTLAGAGAGATIGAATGIPLAPEVGAVIGAGVGKKVGTYIAPPDLTRGDLLKRSLDVNHPVGEIPRVDVTGAKPSAPPVEPLPPPAEPPVNPRENTELHAALAAHYDEQVGDTPYNELEDRFLSDIAIKKKYNVPLDPAERKINLEINKSKVEEIQRARGIAEEQKKAAEKAAADAEKEKKEKLDLNMPLSVGPPFDVSQSEIAIPKEYAELGYTPQRIRVHEAGHVVMIHDAGFSPQEIISHLHDDADGNLASVRWDDSEFKDDSGKPDIEKITSKLPDILAMIYGGPIAEEMLHGTPVHSNPGAAMDFKLANQLMDLTKVPPVERGAMMKIAELKARGVLTKPGVIDTIKKYTDYRKAGLDENLHMDPETVGAMTQEIKNLGGNNGTDNNNATSGKNGGLGKEGNAGGEGGVSSKTEKTARPAGEKGESSRSSGSSEKRGLKPKIGMEQGGHAGGGVVSLEELSRPGRFVKISRSGIPTDQGKVSDFNLGAGEAGYQVKPDGSYELKAGEETPATSRGVKAYASEVFPEDLRMAIKNKEAPKTHEVYDTHTGDVMSQHTSAKRARSRVDKLDNEYGGYRYASRPIKSVEQSGDAGELRTDLKDKEAPPITEIIPELKSHPELEKKIKDLGFESALQKEWMRQQGQKKTPVEYRPSEKAETLSAQKASDLGPEFIQAEHAHEANRLKQIIDDPSASEEEKAIAVQRLKEGTELPAKVLPPERTTGIAEHDAAIKAGGGIPGGVTDLGEFGKIYNYHDPLTGSTLGFKEGKEITPETVKEQIKKSREAFGIKEEPVKEDHDKHARNHEGE